MYWNISGDIRNEKDVEVALKNIDVVFHTAAFLNFNSNLSHDRPLCLAINVTGTQVKNK